MSDTDTPADPIGNVEEVVDNLELTAHQPMVLKGKSETVEEKTPSDLQAVFDVPVKVSAVLGRARLAVAELLEMGPGTILQLDRKVGESIDIFVNDRLIARGEVVLVENQLGVTMTEIIKQD